MLARQVLYHLNHAPCLFLGYFSGRVLSFCLGLALDQAAPTYGLPRNWDHKHVSLCLALVIEMKSR
jgi:hypothetical protein